jgi:hypothetical protein
MLVVLTLFYRRSLGSLDIVESSQKCAGVLVKAGRSQVYYGLDLSSTS